MIIFGVQLVVWVHVVHVQSFTTIGVMIDDPMTGI